MLAAFTTLASFDRYRWRTIGIVTSFYIVQSILKMLATAVPGLKASSPRFSPPLTEKYVSIADLVPSRRGRSSSIRPRIGRQSSNGPRAGGSLVFFITTSLLCYGIAFWQFHEETSRSDLIATATTGDRCHRACRHLKNFYSREARSC